MFGITAASVHDRAGFWGDLMVKDLGSWCVGSFSEVKQDQPEGAGLETLW